MSCQPAVRSRFFVASDLLCLSPILACGGLPSERGGLNAGPLRKFCNYCQEPRPAPSASPTGFMDSGAEEEIETLKKKLEGQERKHRALLDRRDAAEAKSRKEGEARTLKAQIAAKEAQAQIKKLKRQVEDAQAGRGSAGAEARMVAMGITAKDMAAQLLKVFRAVVSAQLEIQRLYLIGSAAVASVYRFCFF